MKSTIYSVVSNFIARIWSILISLLVLPLYTKILGFESYGLIGFFGTLLSSLAILDLGLSTTLNREMSRSLVLEYDKDEFRNMVYSIELIYWFIGIVLGIIVVVFAPLIAEYWISSEGISVSNVKYAVMLMGGVIAFQWPLSIYGGGLMGLQKQVQYNGFFVIFSTLKSVGVILVLKYISSSIFAFFLYQIIITLCAVFFLKKLMWYFIPKSNSKSVFSYLELKKIGKFAVGMTGVGLSTLFLGQLDKIILSKLLPLKQFGYYTFGFSIGSCIALLSGVLGSVLLPKLNQVVAKNNLLEIKNEYHKTTKIYAAAITPPAMILLFFSKELLTIWMGDVESVKNIWVLVSLIACGGLFNTYVTASYFLMLAYGWTKFTIYQNTLASLISIPLLIVSVNYFGLIGGASICVVSNLGYFLVSLPLIHKKLLIGELKQVYLTDILPYLLISLASISCFKFFFHESLLTIFNLIYILVALLFTYILTIIVTKEYRLIFWSIAYNLRSSLNKL
jgi:O-antigen/teichoic acid export membrane protein